MMRRARRSRRHPIVNRPALTPAQRQNIQILAISGTLLCIVSLGFTAVGIYQLQQTVMLMNFEGVTELSEISMRLEKVTRDLAKFTEPLALGTWILLIGGGMVTYALQWGRYRERWFFWSTLILAILNVWHPILGTVLGAWWLWYLIWNRPQFSPQQAILIAK